MCDDHRVTVTIAFCHIISPSLALVKTSRWLEVVELLGSHQRVAAEEDVARSEDFAEVAHGEEDAEEGGAVARHRLMLPLNAKMTVLS
jgi:hypothetical protein